MPTPSLALSPPHPHPGLALAVPLPSWSKWVSAPPGPGTEHTSLALRKVLHLFTSTRWPPASFWGVRVRVSLELPGDGPPSCSSALTLGGRGMDAGFARSPQFPSCCWWGRVQEGGVVRI